MQAKDALRTALLSTQNMVPMFLSDLSDGDLLVRPVPTANHTAWQLGHLINSESLMLKSQLPTGVYPELPAGWADQYSNQTASVDPPRGFTSKAEYLNLFNQVRQGTLANLDALAEKELDRPSSGRLAQFAPTLGAMFLLVSNHTLMHLGQVSVVRRQLGKPRLF